MHASRRPGRQQLRGKYVYLVYVIVVLTFSERQYRLVVNIRMVEAFNRRGKARRTFMKLLFLRRAQVLSARILLYAQLARP